MVKENSAETFYLIFVATYFFTLFYFILFTGE